MEWQKTHKIEIESITTLPFINYKSLMSFCASMVLTLESMMTPSVELS